ncbi:MAG TPA: endonuclease/exonuclease/phosphatase family protein, partial [Chthoniobacteraceae bacterium]
MLPAEANQPARADTSGGEPAGERDTARWPRVRRFLRSLLTLLNHGFILGLIALLLAIELGSARHWLLSLLLYAPPPVFLAPLILLTPWAVLARRWHLVLGQGLAVLVVCLGYMTVRWVPWPVGKTGEELTVVTFNAGQSEGAEFNRFLAAEHPDVVLLQDARSAVAEVHRWYPVPFRAGRDQFAILSKHPVGEPSLIMLPGAADPVAARFEVTIKGTVHAFYNVRMPTPRQQFRRFLEPSVRRELWTQRERSAVLSEYRQWLANRVELARGLADVFRSEKLPFIVGGDFNHPDHGPVHRLFASQMTDCFAESGRGWGFTFPGERKNRLSFLPPWLRLDFLYAGRGWRPV